MGMGMGMGNQLLLAAEMHIILQIFFTTTLDGLCKAVLLVLTFRRHCRSLEIGRGVGD